MPTAKLSTTSFLTKNAEIILTLCVQEGFSFLVKGSSNCITVRCTLPDGTIRFVIFDDHRIENPHGNKPHVCNQWHKALGEPLSFTMGKDVKDSPRLQKILQAVSIMCLTQSSTYNKMKEEIFS